jgi:hypothetical protein
MPSGERVTNLLASHEVEFNVGLCSAYQLLVGFFSLKEARIEFACTQNKEWGETVF